MHAREIDKLTLYGDTMSGNCLKPRWTADYLNIPYDWVEIDIFKNETQTEEFLALNPVGQVPLARWPDGRILPQSNAIMVYLAQGSDLIPTDAFTRAQMESWLYWEQYSHEPYIAVRRSKMKYRGLSEDELDPDLLVKGRRALGVMELQLTYTDWLASDGLTCADIALVSYTRVAHEGGFDLSEFPNIQRWITRVESALNLSAPAPDPRTVV